MLRVLWEPNRCKQAHKRALRPDFVYVMQGRTVVPVREVTPLWRGLHASLGSRNDLQVRA